MNLSHGLMSAWMHGADPLRWLCVDEKIVRLRQEIAKGNFFPALISKYFLNNPHRLTFVGHAQEDYNAQLAKEEEIRLKQMVDRLTPQQKEQILEDGKVLVQLQNTMQGRIEQRDEICTSYYYATDISVLPTLALSDVASKAKVVELEHEKIGDVPVQWRKTATNDITYFRAIASLDTLPEDLRPYMPLFTSVCVCVCEREREGGRERESVWRGDHRRNGN